MLQELQSEPTAVDVLTAIINAKQPEPLDTTPTMSILDGRAIWMPKYYQDLEKAFRLVRESQIRRPI